MASGALGLAALALAGCEKSAPVSPTPSPTNELPSAFQPSPALAAKQHLAGG